MKSELDLCDNPSFSERARDLYAALIVKTRKHAVFTLPFLWIPC